MLRAIQTAIRADGRILSNDAISMVHDVSRLLLGLLVLGTHLMLLSCASQRMALTPLTEPERQGLGRIGVGAEASRLETQYFQSPSIVDSGLRVMLDWELLTVSYEGLIVFLLVIIRNALIQVLLVMRDAWEACFWPC